MSMLMADTEVEEALVECKHVIELCDLLNFIHLTLTSIE